MNPSDLRSRLDAIKDRDSTPSVEVKGTGGDQALPLAEKGLTENGWNRIAGMVYEKTSYCDNPLHGIISDFLLPEEADASRFVFYDCETTGLSGGAGNMVFLIGFGIPEGNKLRTVQIMLTDFPGEPAFLEALDRYISPDKIYVSYNGRSFDTNILKSRHAMNGMRMEFGFQLDLLYPARRLWKNIIGSCSLGDIEKNILLKNRALDVPGFMVPDFYFEFIKSGIWSSIERVISHHLDDIQSLAQLLSVFEKIYENPLSFRKVDRAGLARLLMDRHPDDAVNVLCAGFDEGSLRSAVELGLHYKRRGSYSAACLVWRRMWEAGQNIFAGVELAKHYEHREKKIDKALFITRDVLSLERIRIRAILPELEKRRARLEGKLEKSFTSSDIKDQDLL
ncbi:MAG: ribonuclease H-like domain-containing protein [Spirochaetia bacterium]|nr:ribonuclease H-like domain-containing protein [Spirochaetia bacterium]